MMKGKNAVTPLEMLNIVPMNPDACPELAADARQLWEEGVITSTAFICTLVPESTPAIEKGEILGSRFRHFRQALGDTDMPVGVLIQATIGHGWTPNAVAPFQRCVFPAEPNPYIFCALDEDFKAYIRRQVRSLAACKPDFFMVDDDLRYLAGRDGCYCPLHLARFNREHGTSWTAEALMEAVKSDEVLAAEYDALQLASLDELAQVIREAIDAEAPGTPCSFCACSTDARHARKITMTLKAPGDVPVVRINNGSYLQDSIRRIPEWLMSTAMQYNSYPEEFRILDEPDTCPQNRWSTSAAWFHNHLVCSIAEGCRGGKLWLYRNTKGEMDSGLAYRDVLRKNIRLYEKVASMQIRWGGAATVLSKEPPMNFPPSLRHPSLSTWSTAVLGKMGMPFHFTTAPRGLVTLAGKDCRALSDAELQRLLENECVLLDGEAAIEAASRGFAALMGTDARPWEGLTVSNEMLPDGSSFRSPGSCARLLPATETEVLSRYYHQPSGCSSEMLDLGAGATFHANPSGGKVAVIAGFILPYGFGIFNMLCTNRKRMLLDIFRRFGKLDWYIPGDQEIMLRSGVADGEEILMLLNLSLDDCECIKICCNGDRKISGICELTPDGEWAALQWSRNGDKVTIDRELRPLRPLLLKMQ